MKVNGSLMIRISLAALIFSALTACVGKGPFQQVQFCLRDQSSTADFIAMMKEISATYEMRYVDRSLEADQESKTLNIYPGYRGLTISAHRKDGLGWGAGNFGANGFDVSIGFSEGANPDESRRFADSVIRTIGEKWQVHDVPSDSGAMPRCEPRSGSSASSAGEA